MSTAARPRSSWPEARSTEHPRPQFPIPYSQFPVLSWVHHHRARRYEPHRSADRVAVTLRRPTIFITYTADGEPPRDWDIDIDDLTESAAERIEQQYRKASADKSLTYDQFRLSVYQGGATARRVLLWHLIRETHPTLRYEDTPDFRRKQLKVELSRGELMVMRDQVEAKVGDLAERQAVLDVLDAEILTARDSLSDPEESGKA